MLEVTDYAALRRASGASPYEEGEEPFGYFNSITPDLPDGAVSDWAVTGHGFGGSFANSAIPEVIESWRGAFGYAIVDTDLGVWVSIEDEGSLLVYEIGDLASGVSAAVEEDPIWSPRVEVVDHNGSEYWNWGAEMVPGDRSDARRLSIGGQLAVDGALALRTLVPEVMEASLEVARSGRAREKFLFSQPRR